MSIRLTVIGCDMSLYSKCGSVSDNMLQAWKWGFEACRVMSAIYELDGTSIKMYCPTLKVHRTTHRTYGPGYQSPWLYYETYAIHATSHNTTVKYRNPWLGRSNSSMVWLHNVYNGYQNYSDTENSMTPLAFQNDQICAQLFLVVMDHQRKLSKSVAP